MTLERLLHGNAVDVAPLLLGRVVTTRVCGAETAIVLTEVEAYEGQTDPASHAFRGQTARNRSMFGPAGTLYVYRSYGIHWCMNVVVGPEGTGAAVLVRAGVVVAGLDVIRRRRGRTRHVTDGPGKVCEALGVDGSMDATSVLGPGPVVLSETRIHVPRIEATPRIGITKAPDLPWRFVGRFDDRPTDRVRG